MKVCKKCKHQLANKSKICKYCGSDVSKSKIIKTVNNSSKKNVKSISDKSKIYDKKTSNKYEQKSVDNKKENLAIKNKNDKENLNPKLKQKSKIKIKSYNIKNKKNNKKRNLKIKDINKNNCKRIRLIKDIKNIVKSIRMNVVFKKEKYDAKNNVKLNKKASKQEKNQNRKLNTANLKTNLLSFFSVIVKILKKTRKFLFLVLNVVKSFFVRYKVLIICSFGVLFITIGCFFGINVYKSLSVEETPVLVTENATTEKIFSMGDIISYNGVLYKVVKVETSNGNTYKKPKDGYQFLIVTVYIKNTTDKKVPYSYANWTMANSKGEEKRRIFTSINVDTALYSGNLVIGGVKTGSIVFEQPINDSKLVMNFYDLKKDNYGNDTADKSKRIFSVSISVPKNSNKK